MIKGIAEALVGYRLDPLVGPIIMAAAGGVRAELYRDRSVRLAPVDIDTAREMIGEVKGLAALDGYRGTTPGDLDALARTIVALSSLAGRSALPVWEAEINPLLILPRGDGVVAVDALVIAGDGMLL
jgi:hypothetical protein